MTCTSNCGRYVVPLAAAAAFTLVLVLPCGAQGGSVYGHIELSAVGDTIDGAAFLGIGKDDGTGWSVSSAGDFNGDGVEDLLISAHTADWQYNNHAGKVYLVYGRAGERPFWGDVDLATLGATTAGVTFTGTDWWGHAGIGLASAGDVNGDGLDDLLIGAPGVYSEEGPLRSIGRTYLIYGEPGLAGIVDLGTVGDATYGAIFEGAETYEWAGHAVSSAGDVDGDGLADLLISAQGFGPLGLTADKAYLIYGRQGRNEYEGTFNLAAVGNEIPGVLFTGVSGTHLSNENAASAGDVNGDGLDDLLLGAFRADPNGVQQAGETYLIYGQSEAARLSGTIDVSTVGDTVAGAVFEGSNRIDRSGFSVSSAGDVNGDGPDDLLIGALSGNGKAYLVYGRAGDGALSGRIRLSSIGTDTAGAKFVGLDFGDKLGHVASSAGDFNGDGLNDVLIGAPHLSGDSGAQAGAAYLIYGQSGDDTLSGTIGLDTLGRETPGAVFHGSQQRDRAGIGSAIGDFNGDGLDDLLIGAWSADPNDVKDAGTTYLIYGQPLPEVFGLASVASGDWSAAATWDDGSEVPLSFMNIEVGPHTVVVAEDGAAGTLLWKDAESQVTIRSETMLRVFELADVAAGTLALDWDARLDAKGDLHFGEEAVYQSQLRGPWYGLIDADGDVSLGGRLHLEAIGSINQPGDHQRTIVRAEGALTGDFSITPSPGQHLGNGIFYEGLVHLDGEEGEASTIDVQVFQAAAGDTNGDRQLDNADLQRILGANSFDRPGDWDWPQGDFNGDRHVDNRDLQRILATGYFGTGPYAATAAATPVPEPPTLLLALTALLALLSHRRRRFTVRRATVSADWPPADCVQAVRGWPPR